jgi:DNA invertase Pin-like site-specific DNA recombinase
MAKLFLTIAAAFAEAERDRIRERVSQVKADQKARGAFSADRSSSDTGPQTTARSSPMSPSREPSAI